MSEEGSKKLIGEWLIELEENETLREEFRADPEKTLETSGLDPDQQRIVRDGSLAEIRDAIRNEYDTSKILLFPVWHFFTAEEESEDYGSEESE